MRTDNKATKANLKLLEQRSNTFSTEQFLLKSIDSQLRAMRNFLELREHVSQLELDADDRSALNQIQSDFEYVLLSNPKLKAIYDKTTQQLRKEEVETTKQILEKHFRDRTKALETMFTDDMSKPSGLSTGYVGREKKTNTQFMIKSSLSNIPEFTVRLNGSIELQDAYHYRPQNITLNAGEQITIKRARQDYYDGMCIVNESITAGIYKRILGDRAPIITHVQPDNPAQKKETENKLITQQLDHFIATQYPYYKFPDDKDIIRDAKVELADPTTVITCTLRSQYLHRFDTLSNFTGGEASHILGQDLARLENVIGAEKLFAAMLFGGELDIHAGNIGVMELNNRQRAFAKIDHGWSATRFFDNPVEMMESFKNSIIKYGYKNKIHFRLDNFQEAVNEITKISDEEIELIIKARIYELKKSGFDIRNLEFYNWHNDIVHSDNVLDAKKLTFNDYEALEEHLITSYKMQRQTFIGLSKRLDIIAKIEKVADDLSTSWYEIGNQEPVVYAITNGRKIDGKDPIVWAIENAREIFGEHPIKWAISNGIQIDGQDAKAWADNQFTNIDVDSLNSDDLKRICNLLSYCKDNKLCEKILERAINEGVQFYSRRLDNNPTVQNTVNNLLTAEVELESPDPKRIRNLLNAGAQPNLKVLEFIINKRKDPNSQELWNSMTIEGVALEIWFSTFCANLIYRQPIQGEEFIIDYITNKFPDLTIEGKPPKDWLADTLKTALDTMETLSDIDKVKNSRFANMRPEELVMEYDSCLMDACLLIAAGAKIEPSKAIKVFTDAIENEITLVFPGTDGKNELIGRWAAKLLTNIVKLENPTAEQLNLANTLLEAGLDKRIQNLATIKKLMPTLDTVVKSQPRIHQPSTIKVR